MKTNPILEEIWLIKDALAREAGYDIHRLCENTRQWASTYPHLGGPPVQDAAALRRWMAEKDRARAETSTFNETP